MDVAKILVELKQEREQIEEAILSLERLARGRAGDEAAHPHGWPRSRRTARPPAGSKNKTNPRPSEPPASVESRLSPESDSCQLPRCQPRGFSLAGPAVYAVYNVRGASPTLTANRCVRRSGRPSVPSNRPPSSGSERAATSRCSPPAFRPPR